MVYSRVESVAIVLKIQCFRIRPIILPDNALQKFSDCLEFASRHAVEPTIVYGTQEWREGG